MHACPSTHTHTRPRPHTQCARAHTHLHLQTLLLQLELSEQRSTGSMLPARSICATSKTLSGLSTLCAHQHLVTVACTHPILSVAQRGLSEGQRALPRSSCADVLRRGISFPCPGASSRGCRARFRHRQFNHAHHARAHTYTQPQPSAHEFSPVAKGLHFSYFDITRCMRASEV